MDIIILKRNILCTWTDIEKNNLFCLKSYEKKYLGIKIEEKLKI